MRGASEPARVRLYIIRRGQWGGHTLRLNSATQAIISLSTGGAEFYEAVKAAPVGIELIHMLADLGVQVKQALKIRVDAIAGVAIASRLGAGRIRHIRTPATSITYGCSR